MDNGKPISPSVVPRERQAPLYSAIASELVELTPESWLAVELRVSVNRSQTGGLGMTHEIVSPDAAHREPVVASDKLFEMTRSLLALFEEFSSPWVRMTFFVNASNDGGWRFRCDFE